MSRWAFLLLPLPGLLLFDPVTPDNHALKSAGLMAGALLCVALALPRGRLACTRLSFALWIFVGARAATLLEAPAAPRALRWWSLLLALALVHHLSGGVLTRAWLRRRAPPVLAAAATLLAALALLQAAAGAPQAHALFANRSFAGVGLAMLLPFVLALRARLRGVSLRWPGLLLVLAGLLATRSRTGALAAAAALVLWALWRRPRLRLPLAAGAGLLVVLAGLWLGEANTVKVRLAWYGAAWRMGLEQSLLGTGADGFAREYPPVRSLEEHAISGGRRVHAVHNDYLESFAEGGVPGLAAHLLLFGAALWALRRQRAASASLLALAAGSLVDLPLRDPSLLALAFVPLAFAERRRTTSRLALPAGLAAMLAIGFFVPHHFWHWRADRLFGLYLENRHRPLLDAVLAREPLHREALIERSTRPDLERLLAMEPHNAGALYNRTRFLPPEEVPAALRAILLRHDPHHLRTRWTLAQLVMENDPAQAASLLEEARLADPRPARTWVLTARLHRIGGRRETAGKYLAEAEARSRAPEVARERLAWELEGLREGRYSAERLRDAAARLPLAELRGRAERALARAEAVERDNPPPRVERRPGESAAEHARRIEEAKQEWRSQVASQSSPAFREAFVLAETCVEREPAAGLFRLLGRAARGLGELRRGTQMEAVALLLESLDALRAGDQLVARQRLRRAHRAHPALIEEPAVRDALRAFARDNPDVRASLAALLEELPGGADLLGR